MAVAVPGVNKGWLFGLCWCIHFEINFPMSERNHSDKMVSVLAALFLKKSVKKNRHVRFGIPIGRPVTSYIIG